MQHNTFVYFDALPNSEVALHDILHYTYRTQLCGLQYVTNAAMRCQTADYQVEGFETMTSKGVLYERWEAR